MITLRLKTTSEKTTYGARHDGETFGLAIGEFSSKNKPVIYAKVGALQQFI
jgi:hypothetical protein